MKNSKAIRLAADSALLTYEATINLTRNGAEIVLSTMMDRKGPLESARLRGHEGLLLRLQR